MKLQLAEPEIMRALQHYLATRMPAHAAKDFVIRLRWRGKYADVEVKVRAPVPTLTDKVSI